MPASKKWILSYFAEIVLLSLMRSQLLVLCLSCLTAYTWSQESADTLLQGELTEVHIVATRLATPQMRSSRSIYKQDLTDVNRHNYHLALDEALLQIPGIFAMNPYNFSQDLRLAIRGFGARSAFGIRGIKVLVDGVPSTTPDGQSQLDHLDLRRMASMEVINGGGAGLYGNAAGGVISLQSAVPTESGAGAGLKMGSFGFLRSHVEVNHVSEDWVLSGAANYNQIDGYRGHSSARSLIFDGLVQRQITGGQWRLALNVTHSPEALDPGGINLEQVNTDRASARDRNVLFDGGEDITRGSLALSCAKGIGGGQTIKANAYYLIRDFNNRLPFGNGGIVAFLRNYGGVNLQYQIVGDRYRLLTGADVERQSDDRSRYHNLDGERGDLTFDQREKFSTIAFYALQEFAITERLSLQTTARLDLLSVKAEDKFLANGDQSGKVDWQHFSPSVGLNYQFAEGQHAFARFGHSFETPALSELSNRPDGSGGFNVDLQPQQSDHFELGVKGRWGAGARYQVAFFHIDIDRELIPFELADFPGRTFFENSGTSRRNGIEIALAQQMGARWSGQCSYTYSDFEFKSFELDGEVLDGKTTPGIPKHFAGLGLYYDDAAGLSAAMDLRYTGQMFADNTNEVEVDDYAYLNLRLGYAFEWSKSSLTLHGGVRNLTNTKYFDNIRINAFGGRYYEPAPGTHFYAGFDIRF